MPKKEITDNVEAEKRTPLLFMGRGKAECGEGSQRSNTGPESS